MSVHDLIQNGQLADAVIAATNAIKKQPLQPERRVVLAELMCFAGNFNRADELIESASKLNHGGNLQGFKLLRQLLRGEIDRQQWYSAGHAPQVRNTPSPQLTAALEAVVEFRAGECASAVRCVTATSPAKERTGIVRLTTGEHEEFTGFRDLNDLSANVAEMVSGTGQFFWIDWAEICGIRFHPVKTLRDILWRPLKCEFLDGSSENYFMPCLYAGTAHADSESLRLGQSTNFVDLGAGLVSGSGLRMFLIGEAAPSVLELDEIQFNTGVDHGERV